MEILIRTECQVLQWLKESNDVSGRLARWAMHLAALQIKEIKYKLGRANTNSDPLSRYSQPEPSLNTQPEIIEIDSVVNIWDDTNILNKILKEQRKDEKLKSIIDDITTKTIPTFSSSRSPYVLVNGLLYKVKKTIKNQDHRVISNKHLLVISKSIQDKLIAWAHNHPMAGHAGRTKTIYRLSSRVHWVTLRRDVFKYVQHCTLYQQFKYNNQSLSTTMKLHFVTEPWHTVGVDLIGPFPMTQRQKQFVTPPSK